MKRYFLWFVLTVMALTVDSAPVGCYDASALASGFLKQSAVEQVKVPFENFYVFNGDNCFVIISADDCVLPVLGYSFDGAFSVDMAQSTLEWLQNCDTEIQALKDLRLGASDGVQAAWESLRNKGCLPSRNDTSFGPLIATTWHQYAPYNMYCPEGCVTGCVATVMAQIMRYWSCPSKGVGSHYYNHPVYGLQIAKFGETDYDWANMPVSAGESSSQEVKRAVATLNYHCGVSVEMDYGPESSSAPISNMIDAMSTYFRYSSLMTRVDMQDYSDEGWKSLLKDELNALRPVVYVGQDRISAHAFICDGYDASDCFHFNWGWGGTNDGFYAIGALNPSSSPVTLNANNYAVVGIKPAFGGTAPIPAPVDLDVYPSGNNVVLTWNMPYANDFTFKVSRNGHELASGLTETNFTDENVLPGSYTYQVWAVLDEVDSDRKATYEINLARIDVEPDDPNRGSVTGEGLAEVDFLHIVRAIPNTGFVFQCWIEDDVEVSQDAEYAFNVVGNRQLKAIFSGTGVGEGQDTSAVRQVEVYTLSGVKLGTVTGGFKVEDLRLKGYSQGVYLLRETTDKGSVVKKVVLTE